MSLHFDLVICCDLREDTPEQYIEAVRCLTTLDYPSEKEDSLIFPGQVNLFDDFHDHHFLAPDPEHEVISSFHRVYRTSIPHENRDVHRYSLQFSARDILDDYFYSHHIFFISWLASVVFGEFIGYYRDTTNSHVRLLYSHGGKLKVVDHA